MDNTCPVMYDALSDAKKQTASATSLAVPKRFIGINCLKSFSLIPSVISVLIKPGATALTVIPLLPTSCESALVAPITPAFAAE